MGKPFKMQYTRSKKVTVEKEYKMTFDHRSKVPEPSRETMSSFTKNMNVPSDLWDGDVYMNTRIHTKVNKSGTPYCIVESTGESSYTMRVTPRALIFTRD
jgi:hypothetical protein